MAPGLMLIGAIRGHRARPRNRGGGEGGVGCDEGVDAGEGQTDCLGGIAIFQESQLSHAKRGRGVDRASETSTKRSCSRPSKPGNARNNRRRLACSCSRLLVIDWVFRV